MARELPDEDEQAGGGVRNWLSRATSTVFVEVCKQSEQLTEGHSDKWDIQ